MNKKRGFTLIELLAVILILGIIAVIAIPKIAKIIASSRENSFKETARGLYKSAEFVWGDENSPSQYYYIGGKFYSSGTEKIAVKGKLPESGIVDVTETGDVALAIYNGKYCATKAGDEDDIAVVVTTAENCHTYNVIDTKKSWSDIADEYNILLEDLLLLNEETDQNSSTVGRDIMIPIVPITDPALIGGASYIYLSRTIPYTYEAATTKLTVSDNDDGSAPIDLGFEFNFGDNKYTTIHASTNGYITFDATDAEEYENSAIANWFDYPIITAYWGDLFFDFDIMPDSGIYYTIGNESGKDYVLVEWRDVTDLNSDNQDETTTGDFEMKLYENGNVKIYYQDVEFEGPEYSNGVDVTIGVFASSTNHHQYSHFDALISNGAAIEYYLGTGTIGAAGCFGFNATSGAITAYDPSCSNNVIIPETINGVNVTSIGTAAFNDVNLNTVTLHSGIVSIGNIAFANNSLTEIIIPNSVTSIGHGAFAGNQLSNLTLSNSVTQINDCSFCENQLTSVVIPSGVTVIGFGAFSDNQINSVTMPDSVITLEEGAFANNQLASITIPNRVTSIGNGAFLSNQLTSIAIPNSVISLGNQAFYSNRIIQDSATIDRAIGTITLGTDIFTNNGADGATLITPIYLR